MEAKQKTILEKWTEYNIPENLKSQVDENGWLDPYLNLEYFESLNGTYSERNGNLFRPNSLQGIENNNGWKRLQDSFWELDDSKLYEYCNINSGDYAVHGFLIAPSQRYTHFKELKKSEKPPIY